MSDLTPIAPAEVRLEGPRPARLDEREELIAMVNLIFRTSAGRAPTIGSDWAHVYAPQNLANISVVYDAAQDRLVASTGVWACDVVMGAATLRVGGINCVGTLPDYRRHGLGSQVMSASQNKMRELGCQVGLLGTGIMNWYRRLGWEEAGQWRIYRLNRGNIALLPQLRARLHVRVVELGDGEGGEGSGLAAIDEAILALYHQQRMGAARTVADFRQRVVARNYDHLVVAEEAGRPVAYLLLLKHEVIEWAGGAEDVVGLVRAVFEHLDDRQASTSRRSHDPGAATLRTLLLNTPGWQQPITRLLDHLRIPGSADTMGMLYLIDPQAIVAAYGLANVEIETVQGDTTSDEDYTKYRVRTGERQVTLDRRQLTKLLFGPERVSDLAEEWLPLPLCQWYLERV